MARVKIKDIAEKAGVSKTAVSFAFNNPEHLSEGTVKHILSIAEEMGYTPDPVARNLITGKTGTIGLLVPQPIPEIIRNPFTPEFIEGIGEVCTLEGLSLLLVPPLKGSMQRAIGNAAVDGFLTLGLEESKSTMVVLRQRGVPSSPWTATRSKAFRRSTSTTRVGRASPCRSCWLPATARSPSWPSVPASRATIASTSAPCATA
jgi:hypothetical protein